MSMKAKSQIFVLDAPRLFSSFVYYFFLVLFWEWPRLQKKKVYLPVERERAKVSFLRRISASSSFSSENEKCAKKKKNVGVGTLCRHRISLLSFSIPPPHPIHFCCNLSSSLFPCRFGVRPNLLSSPPPTPLGFRFVFTSSSF